MRPLLFPLCLLIATQVFAAENKGVTPDTNAPPRASRERFESKVLKVYVARDGDAESRSYVVMWKGQEIVVPEMTRRTQYTEGDTIKFIAVKTSPGHFMFSIVSEIPEMKMQVKAVNPPAQRSVFFECRNNEVFCIEKDNLEAQVKQALGDDPKKLDALGILQALKGKEIANDCYTVDPTVLTAGVIRLKPRPGSAGDKVTDLDRPENRFQQALKLLGPKHHLIVFIVRDGSNEVRDKARQIAEGAGFTIVLQPLPVANPLSFAIGAEPPVPPK